jgi:tellurite methyltransferase
MPALQEQFGAIDIYMADGTEQYLVDEAMLMQVTKDLGAEFGDPIKTTVVQNLRSMTTWVLRKR